MELQLINAQFDAKDALDILTQMFNVKIKYHENKITGASSEEEIKMHRIISYLLSSTQTNQTTHST